MHHELGNCKLKSVKSFAGHPVASAAQSQLVLIQYCPGREYDSDASLHQVPGVQERRVEAEQDQSCDPLPQDWEEEGPGEIRSG